MKPIKSFMKLVLPGIAMSGSPVLRVFDEIADRQPDMGFDSRENTDDWLLLRISIFIRSRVGRRDPLLIDLRKVIVIESFPGDVPDSMSITGESHAQAESEPTGKNMIQSIRSLYRY